MPNCKQVRFLSTHNSQTGRDLVPSKVPTLDLVGIVGVAKEDFSAWFFNVKAAGLSRGWLIVEEAYACEQQ